MLYLLGKFSSYFAGGGLGALFALHTHTFTVAYDEWGPIPGSEKA